MQASGAHGNVWLSDELRALVRTSKPAQPVMVDEPAPVAEPIAEPVTPVQVDEAPAEPQPEAEPACDMDWFRLRRDGSRPLILRGHLLAFARSASGTEPSQSLSIYRTEHGGLVAQAVVQASDNTRIQTLYTVMDLVQPGDIGGLVAAHDPGRGVHDANDVELVRQLRAEFASICTRICLRADAAPQHKRNYTYDE